MLVIENVSFQPPRGGRGIQEVQIWHAAGEPLYEGMRPTIERVRQKVGSDSTNTRLRPILERWFAPSIAPPVLVADGQRGGPDRPPERDRCPMRICSLRLTKWNGAPGMKRRPVDSRDYKITRSSPGQETRSVFLEGKALVYLKTTRMSPR